MQPFASETIEQLNDAAGRAREQILPAIAFERLRGFGDQRWCDLRFGREVGQKVIGRVMRSPRLWRACHRHRGRGGESHAGRQARRARAGA